MTKLGAVSFWYADIGLPQTRRTALIGEADADVAIVGAGYSGLWTAYYLKQAAPHLRVTVLEKRLWACLPKTPHPQLLGGAIVAFCLPVGTFLLTSLVCLGAARISPWLGLAVQMFWCVQASSRPKFRSRA